MEWRGEVRRGEKNREGAKDGAREDIQNMNILIRIYVHMRIYSLQKKEKFIIFAHHSLFFQIGGPLRCGFGRVHNVQSVSSLKVTHYPIRNRRMIPTSLVHSGPRRRVCLLVGGRTYVRYDIETRFPGSCQYAIFDFTTLFVILRLM